MLVSFAVGEYLDVFAFGRDGLDVEGKKPNKYGKKTIEKFS